RARVDPRTISYVEAHGTGTALGDPIEIAALNRVFGAAEAPTRTIGTVKANVGHLESAAGICGLTRVLLQMRHGTVAPSLHSDPPNPRIAFAGSSFRVAREAEPWLRPKVDGREVPRRAGLSSFGAGGANAHLIIEELRDPLVALEPPGRPPFLLVLSARDGERLEAHARAYTRFLRAPRLDAPVDPGRLCHTLQVGREAMAARLAVVGADLEALAQGLEAFLAGGARAGVFQGHVKLDRPRLSALSAVSRPPLTGRIDAAGLERWAELWVSGGEVPWNDIYGQGRPRRMSLPTYPFARESYWVDPRALQPELATFQVRIAADDFRLREHQVHGRPLLPGAALAELLLSAGSSSGQPASRLRELELMAPLSPVGEFLELTFRVHGGAGERLVEVLKGERLAGRARVGAMDPIQQPPRVDLDALRGRCAEESAGADPYERFAREGIAYGPSFRLMTGLWRGDGECVVRLGTAPSAPLAPLSWASLLDAAFQAVAALAEPFQRRHGLHLPHTVGELRISGAPILPAWVHVWQPSPDAPCFDLQLVDDQGRTLAVIEGFHLRPVPAAAAAPRRPELLLVGISPVARASRPGPAPHEHALLFDAEDALWQALTRRHPTIVWRRVSPAAAFQRFDAHDFALDPGQPEHLRALTEALQAEGSVPTLVLDGLADRWDGAEIGPGLPLHTRFLFHLLQTLRRHDRPTRLLSWSRRTRPEHLALHAMFLSVHQEWPTFTGRVLALETGYAEAPDALAAILSDEWRDGDPHAQVLFQQGQRQVPTLELLADPG
ncbi:MAG: polyketide synthase dehydratase domain-containing protein, partial [Byssovorax sp.]